MSKRVSLGFIVAMGAMIGAAHASCSNGTIRGDYAFTVHGVSLSPDGATSTGLFDGVGIINFDGRGNFTQEDFVVRNGRQVPGGPPNPSGFHTGEGGTYSVNDDCTGTLDLQLSPGNERSAALVISKSARTIHSIVSDAVVGGNPALVQIHADFERIDQRE
jgi:hypothetical protein